MFQILLAIMLGFVSPNDTPQTNNDDTTIVTQGEDTGGEMGHIPPKKP